VASRSTTDEGFRSYWLDVRLRQRVSTELDLEDYVDVIHADIVLEEETGPEQIAGRVSGYVLRFDHMADDGIDPLEACDAHSQATLDYYVALFDPDTHEIKAEIDRALQGLMFGNVLILDVIELLPAHRGRRLGLQIARRFIEMFDTGCCLVICDPCPLQFGNPGEDAGWRARMLTEAFTANEDVARARLAAYWQRLGFAEIPGTKLLGMNPTMRQPSLTDVILDG
jgi:hypothetical protein